MPLLAFYTRSDFASHDCACMQCSIIARVSESPYAGSERKIRKPGDRRMFEIEKMVVDVAESVIMTELYPRSEITIIVTLFETDG